jgi:hypothetical protein
MKFGVNVFFELINSEHLKVNFKNNNPKRNNTNVKIRRNVIAVIAHKVFSNIEPTTTMREPFLKI